MTAPARAALPSYRLADGEALDGAVAAAAERGLLDVRSSAPLPGGHLVVDGEWALPVPVHLPDLVATRALGERLASLVGPGDLLVLTGPLGAGKTSLVQGLGAALGVRGAVTSPTFVLSRVHRGPVPLVHVDAYRLRDADDPVRQLEDLDLEAELPHAVTAVEWGEGLAEGLAVSRLEVVLDRADEGRTALLRAVGERWASSPGL